ncbi:MAG: hypothetical protein PHD64_11495 [Mesotoga sp.]|jgi:hypothetical protein|nr:hypothetical protein [Mesotoga sp.]
MEEELEKQIELVRRSRAIVADQKAAIDARMAAWEKENKLLLDSIETDRIQLRDAEAKLREMALSSYALDGNKKPAPGVGIRITKKCDYVLEKALKYAKLHDVCLVLDEKAFVALALKSKDTDIPATIREEAQATIAKEL